MSSAIKLVSLSLLGLMTAPAALADSADFVRCRALADAARRLACYDAVVVTAEPVATPPPRQTPAQFGLDRQAAKRELDAIESHIEGRFDGWGPRDLVHFANGQVWQISDDSTGVLDAVNPRVRVRRGALGAYYLEVDGTNRSPRVRRVQ